MTDEVSESMKIAVLISFMAGFVASVLIVTIFSLNLLNNYGANVESKYNDATSALIDLQNRETCTGPECYKTISDCISCVDTITIRIIGSNVDTPVYKLGSLDNLNSLFTRYTSSEFEVYLTQSGDLYNLKLVEVNNYEGWN
jgi:hypothetical protein